MNVGYLRGCSGAVLAGSSRIGVSLSQARVASVAGRCVGTNTSLQRAELGHFFGICDEEAQQRFGGRSRSGGIDGGV